MNLRLLTAMVALAFPSCAMRLANYETQSTVAIHASTNPRAATQEQRVFEKIPQVSRSTGDFRMTRIVSLHEQAGCGNPLIRTILSAGLLPSTIPIAYVARVDGDRRGQPETREYWLNLSGHYSLWHAVIPASYDDKALARALIGSMSDDRRAPDSVKHSSN